MSSDEEVVVHVDVRLANSAAEADAEILGPGIWEALAARYATASGARGVDEWTNFVAQVQGLALQNQGPEMEFGLRTVLATLVGDLSLKPKPVQFTVFVSHQRLDVAWAEWAAWAAAEAALDYWRDIHDPTLTTAMRASRPRKSSPFSSRGS